jgi:hypothetical protein
MVQDSRYCSFLVDGKSLYDLSSKFMASKSCTTLTISYSEDLGFDKCVSTCATSKVSRTIKILKGEEGIFRVSNSQLMVLSSISLACTNQWITIRISGDKNSSRILVNTGPISV